MVAVHIAAVDIVADIVEVEHRIVTVHMAAVAVDSTIDYWHAARRD